MSGVEPEEPRLLASRPPAGLDHCFLCSDALTAGTKSVEHVFPKWLLTRHGLWQQGTNLRNGTMIPYRQLVVPACKTCNNGPLAQLEGAAEQAFAAGPDAVRALDEEVLFLWLAKIFYGITWREALLPADRRSPADGPIADDEVLWSYELHHIMLRRALGQVDWNEFPGTLFVFDVLNDGTDTTNGFWYFSSFDGPLIGVRSGATLVVGFLQDFGAVRTDGIEHEPRIAAAQQLELHPLQCVEVLAVFQAKLSMRTRAVKFMITGGGDRPWGVFALPQGGLSGRSPFDDWDDDFAYYIVRSLLAPYGVHFDPERRSTLLIGSNGQPIQAPNGGWMPEVWDHPDVLAANE